MNHSPHAPESGPGGKLLGRFHFTGGLWFRVIETSVRILPRWVWPVCVFFFVTLLFFIPLRARRAIASNLEAVLGPCGWWRRQARIYRTMWSFGWCVIERYEHVGAGRRAAQQVEGEDIWRELLAEPAGVVLVTAHIGHWEVGAMAVPGRRVHVVREEELDPRAQEVIRRQFEEMHEDRFDFRMHFARADPTLGTMLLQALRRGDLVALQGDRPRAAGRTSRVELFGRPLDLPAGTAALARAAQVPLLPIFVFREARHRSRLVFRPPIHVTGPGRAGLDEAVRKIAGEVEAAIRRRPHQWFCFRELWPEDD